MKCRVPNLFTIPAELRTAGIVTLLYGWELLMAVEWEIPEEQWETTVKKWQRRFSWKLAKRKLQRNRGLGCPLYLPPRRSYTPAVGCNPIALGDGGISHMGPLLFLFLSLRFCLFPYGVPATHVTGVIKSCIWKDTKVPFLSLTLMSTATIIIHPN